MTTTLRPPAVDHAVAAPQPPRPAARRHMLGERGLLALVFVLALAHGALYAALIPPWQAPDEIAHFEYARLFSDLWHPLWLENASPELEQQIIQSLYAFHAWTYVGSSEPAVRPERFGDVPFFGQSRTLTRFSISYILYALAARPFEGAGLLTQLYVMRAVSVTLGAVMVLLTYLLARQVEPAAPALAWGSALFVLLLPQHTFISASVSDHALAEPLATLTVYGLVRLWRQSFSWRWLVVILVAAVGALLAKSTAVFLVPLLVIAALWGGARWYTAPGTSPRQRRQAWLALLLGLVGLLVGGPLFLAWFNRVSSQLVNITSTIQAAAADYALYFNHLFTTDVLNLVVTQTFDSFWGYFGWMVVPLPQPWVLVPYGLTLLALTGWGLRLAAEQRLSGAYQWVALAAGLAMLVLLTWFISSPIGLGYSQGRYLFGAIAPLAVLLVGGWLGGRPAQHQAMWLLGLLAVWVALDAAALFTVVVPYFYWIA